MKVIKNKEEFESFYPYPKSNPTTYPKEYPCICKVEQEERGIMGDERVVYVAYYPKSLNYKDTFLAGLSYDWKILRN